MTKHTEGGRDWLELGSQSDRHYALKVEKNYSSNANLLPRAVYLIEIVIDEVQGMHGIRDSPEIERDV